MRRFYFPQPLDKPTIRIDNTDEVHHITHVLRMKEGDQIKVFNGQGQEAVVTLQSLSATAITGKIDQLTAVQASENTRVVLACAMPKRAKFEFIIEKATELGVDEIIPLKTKRTEVDIKEDRAAGKQERFNKIAIEASKQCGRVELPHIHSVVPFNDVFKFFSAQSLVIIPSLHGESRHIKDVLAEHKGIKQVAVLIGPEGDFTPDEVARAVEKGAVPVSLGSTVLKVDTAALAVVSLIRLGF